MAITMVASALKWPVAIDAFQAALSTNIVDKGPVQTPADVALASAIMAAAEECDGVVMEEMHTELSKTGRAGCCTGLIWMLRRLDFLTDDDEDGSQPAESTANSQSGRQQTKRKADAGPEQWAQRRRTGNPGAGVIQSSGGVKGELRLGKLQTPYVVECGFAAVRSCRWLVGAGRAGGRGRLTWAEGQGRPAGRQADQGRVGSRAGQGRGAGASQHQQHQATPGCGSGGAGFAGSADHRGHLCVLRCSGAGDAIWKDSSGYTYKTIARKIIVVMAEPGNLRLSASGDSGAHGCVWDKMHIEELMKWIPDEDEHLKPLSSMMGGEIRKLFGMSPPWISCFTCYMGVLKKGQIDVLQKSSSLDVLNAIERLQSTGVSPSIESVVQALMRPRDSSETARAERTVRRPAG